MPRLLNLHASLRGKLRRAEVVLAAGPSAEGAPGSGTFADLYGHAWALGWDRVRKTTVLMQEQAGVWAEVEPLEPLPELSKPARHIGLAFDGSARPIICWQGVAGIFVRQWDAFGTGYVVRGPFDGCDPVVVADAVPRVDAGGSDVAMYYLTDDRSAVEARLERDTYTVPYPVADLPAPASGSRWYLDQHSAAAYRVALELATDRVADPSLPKAAQDLERLRLESDLYPVPSGEALAMGLGARGAYDETTQPHADAEALDLTLGARGEYVLGLFLREAAEGLDLTLGARGEYAATMYLSEDADALDLMLGARGEYDQTTATRSNADGLDLTLGARGEYQAI